jgi:hypothetical protein
VAAIWIPDYVCVFFFFESEKINPVAAIRIPDYVLRKVRTSNPDAKKSGKVRAVIGWVRTHLMFFFLMPDLGKQSGSGFKADSDSVSE